MAIRRSKPVKTSYIKSKYENDIGLTAVKLLVQMKALNFDYVILDNSVTLQAKYSVAVEDWMAENECGAFCIQESFGCASCLTMSMMGETLMHSAIGMYALTLASGKPAALLDWNNNHGEKWL